MTRGWTNFMTLDTPAYDTFPARVAELLRERSARLEALKAIDATLGAMARLMGERPPAPVDPEGGPSTMARRARGTFALTAEEDILSLLASRRESGRDRVPGSD